MLRSLPLSAFLLLSISLDSLGQSVFDDFEGNGNISTWAGDDAAINTAFSNPFIQGINTSATVLEYRDEGGSWANARFDVPRVFDFSDGHTFTLKIYVPSSSITGNSSNQVALKLQNNELSEPWTTQTEIIKSIVLDQWQELSFDFKDDSYVNLDPNSPDPTMRNDLNRVLIQLNGEGNNDHVIAYIDDFSYDGKMEAEPAPTAVYDQLVWSDEFEGNGMIDTSKWFHQTQLPNGTGWFNNELQHYTDREENSYLEGGYMYINAIKEEFTDQGVTKSYTSARLNSKFAFTYGRVEARAKLPFGVGTWPAIWMLGKNIIETGAFWTNIYGTEHWPYCGEIDIMEHWGTNQNYISSAIHTPSSSGGTVNHGGMMAADVSNTFHTFTMDWFPEKIEFRMDGTLYYTYEPEVKNPDTWPFTEDQFLLLNVAMVGDVDPNFTESPMVLDYLRVYQESGTGQVEYEKPTFEIYPNPAQNTLYLSIEPERIGAHFTIKNAQGESIDQYSASDPKFQIDTSYYPAGVYIIVMNDGVRSIAKRFVVL